MMLRDADERRSLSLRLRLEHGDKNEVGVKDVELPQLRAELKLGGTRHDAGSR